MFPEYKECSLCPRECKVDRYKSVGFCGMPAAVTAAKASLHLWEEPCISCKNGAGTVFFSGCNLGCVFCQNAKISSDNFGLKIDSNRLADVFLKLRDMGADNIELVTGTHFLPEIIAALDLVRHKLDIPVVWNCGGYELTETVKRLEGYVDVFLPDIKYFSPEISAKYSSAPDYFEYASKAVLQMIAQTGKLAFNIDGGLIKGTVIRHLVLPGCRHDSMRIMDWIAENTSPEERLVSIMSQYTPFEYIPEKFPDLHRRVTKMEYNSVVRHALELGLDGFTQDVDSAREEYVPEFDLENLVRSSEFGVRS